MISSIAAAIVSPAVFCLPLLAEEVDWATTWKPVLAKALSGSCIDSGLSSYEIKASELVGRFERSAGSPTQDFQAEFLNS
jgi:hypothetical protein